MALLKKKPKARIEEDHQKALVSWFGLQYPQYRALLASFPNEGRRNIWEGRRLKEMGMSAGMPDLAIFVPRGSYHGLFIELKSPDKGRLQESQRQKLADLNAQGYLAVCCYGWRQAADTIQDYMAQGIFTCPSL